MFLNVTHNGMSLQRKSMSLNSDVPVKFNLFSILFPEFSIFFPQFPVSFPNFPFSFSIFYVPFPIFNVLFSILHFLFSIFHFPARKFSYFPFPLNFLDFPISLGFPISHGDFPSPRSTPLPRAKEENRVKQRPGKQESVSPFVSRPGFGFELNFAYDIHIYRCLDQHLPSSSTPVRFASERLFPFPLPPLSRCRQFSRLPIEIFSLINAGGNSLSARRRKNGSHFSRPVAVRR